MTMRTVVIRPEAAEQNGTHLIACSHISHLDPFLISVLVKRPIDWMARAEFFRHRGYARILTLSNAFSVRRFGVPVSAIRSSIRRLEQGRVVGICPEGGVTQGHASCLRGGTIKKGVCLISYRTGRPVLPCVILGTDKLNRVLPWLPFRRSRLWVAFGDRLIQPRLDLDRRAARAAMAEELGTEFTRLFRELLAACDIPEQAVP